MNNLELEKETLRMKLDEVNKLVEKQKELQKSP